MPPSGTVEELLDEMHRRSREDIAKFTAFTGAHNKTVAGWLLGTSKPPSGEMFVRVACYFELNGWSVKEIVAAPPLAVRMAQFWTLEVLTAAQIKKALFYTSTDNQALFTFLSGKHEPLPAAQASLMKFLSKYEADYAEARVEALEEFGLSQLTSDDDSRLIGRRHNTIVNMLAALLREAQPLAELVESDDFSDEDRDHLRELVGRDKFMFLSTTLNRLTSWRTREAR